ncbi:MAG TPA: ABC transporter ATP-binding protein [Acidimicrobiales bacterium]|jgi:putative ABC transport system ATP-binding protein|nr:ABC transporter ATP-binding protein [Acidimicrobiales bacterium]
MTFTPTQPLDDRGSTAESAYHLAGVDRSYHHGNVAVNALRNITLEVATGEMIALQGPSGSGKSTLLQLLGALDTPTRGSIVFFGRELSGQRDRALTAIRRDEIGFVFQQFNLIPTLSAEENVAVAMIPTGTARSERLERARSLLGRVGLSHRLDHLPSRLSGGEQQRVAIARALANAPKVLIADEPTGNLDTTTAGEVMAIIGDLHAESGVTVIIATHDEEIATRAQRRVQLRDGSIFNDSSETP